MSSTDSFSLVGKVLAVKYGASERDFAYIEVIGIERVGGRDMLVGRTVQTPWDESEPTRLCIAWERVNAYYEFDTVEACLDTMNSWGRSEKKGKSWFT